MGLTAATSWTDWLPALVGVAGFFLAVWSLAWQWWDGRPRVLLEHHHTGDESTVEVTARNLGRRAINVDGLERKGVGERVGVAVGSADDKLPVRLEPLSSITWTIELRDPPCTVLARLANGTEVSTAAIERPSVPELIDLLERSVVRARAERPPVEPPDEVV